MLHELKDNLKDILIKGLTIAVLFGGGLYIGSHNTQPKLIAYKVSDVKKELAGDMVSYDGSPTKRVEVSLTPVDLFSDEKKRYEKKEEDFFYPSSEPNNCDSLRKRNLFNPYRCVKDGDIYIHHHKMSSIDCLINKDAIPNQQEVLQLIGLQEVKTW